MEYNRDKVRERFKDLFDNSFYLVFVYSLDGYILDINDVVLLKYGYSLEEVINKPFKKFITKESLLKVFESIKEFRETGNFLKANTYNFKKKNGELLQTEIFGIPLKKNGDVYAILAIGHDVTRLKNAEQKLKESEENYRRAYERENFYKNLFVHDMNNILQSMLMALDLCLLKSKSIENDKDLYKIRKQINRGANLVKNVKRLSEIKDFERKLKHMNIKEVLDESIKIANVFSEEKSINLIINSIDEDLTILANEFLFDVFENLLFNAIKHNNNFNIEITIQISKVQEKGKNMLQIEFRDNGKGIPNSMKKIIFNKGKQEDRSKSGMGLGLSLVKIILDSYNAKIRVENNFPDDYTKGSNFILTFPIKDD